MNTLRCQKAFRIKRCHAASSSSRDGLAVNLICCITGYEYSFHVRAGTAGHSFYIAHFIHFNPRAEYIRIRFVSDCDKETCDRDNLLCTGLVVPEPRAFNDLISDNLQRFRIPEDFDVGHTFYPVLHGLGCTHLIAAYNHVNFLAQLGQVGRFLSSGITGPDDGHFLSAEKKAIAYCAGTHSPTGLPEAGFAGQPEPLGRGACCDNHRIGGYHMLTIIELHEMLRAGKVHAGGPAGADIRFKTQGLIFQVFHHPRAVHSFGISRKVVHVSGVHELSARLHTLVHDRLEVSTRGVDGGGISSGAAPDDQALDVFVWFHSCFSIFLLEDVRQIYLRATAYLCRAATHVAYRHYGMGKQESNSSRKEWAQAPREPIIMSHVENLRVLYEDNHIIAVNKRNSDIIQSDISGDPVLCDVVRDYVRYTYNKPGLAFIGTVHRLDRPVSGVVLYARTTKALNRMSNQFKYREVQKTYWAVVKGMPPDREGHVVNYLWKDEKQNKTFAFDTPADNRKESELRYKVVGEGDHYTYVEVYPKTGRHHQIRATLSGLGCPIKGDVKYGSRRTNDNASIHLHARKIEFVHPVKRIPISIVAPPPEDVLWDDFLRMSLG